MIAKTIIGKAFGGLVKYALNPEKNPEVLAASGVRYDHHRNATQDFNVCRALRPSIGNAVWHTSLSFAYQDQVDNEKMTTIAEDFIQEIGLKESQYLVVRHHDADHEHLHIIANRVKPDGGLVSDQFSVNRSAKISDQLEEKYNLTVAREQRITKVNDKIPLKKQVRQEIYLAIQESLQKGCQSIDQLSAHLEKSGITLRLHQQSTGRINGISFRKDEISFKGTAVNRNFTYGKLVKEFELQLLKHKKNNQGIGM